MKGRIKFGLMYATTAVLSASLVIGTTASLKSYNSSRMFGQGGLDTVGLPDISYSTLKTVHIAEADIAVPADDTSAVRVQNGDLMSQMSQEEIALAAAQEEEASDAFEIAKAELASQEAASVSSTSYSTSYMDANSLPDTEAIATQTTLDSSDLLLVEKNEYNSLFTEDTVKEEPKEELTYFAYRVRNGDSFSKIAEKYNITQDTLYSVNNIKSARTLKENTYLKIPSMSGILYTAKSGDTAASIAKAYSINAEKCAYVNNLSSQSAKIKSGTTIFIPDAKLDDAERAYIAGELFKIPIRAHFTYTSYYGYRQNPFNATRTTFHNGVDMACPRGTPIYAAQSGIVTTAGWSNVYGNYVIIKHYSGGYKTLYGHMMSAPFVKAGDIVDSTTVIGKVGTTGQSTGNHLHFTVYKGDSPINPLTYF